jgi:hypothetical protein
VLSEALRTLSSVGIPCLVMGGIASALVGRHRWTRDVDLLVRLADGDRARLVLDDADFETEDVVIHGHAHRGVGWGLAP